MSVDTPGPIIDERLASNGLAPTDIFLIFMVSGHGHFDVVVAGGGLIGLASAWYLRASGQRVAIVEAGNVGREASWAGGGILFPIYPWKYPAAVQRLAQRSRAMYDVFTAEVDDCSGIDSENRRSGLYVLDADESAAAQAWAQANEEPIEALSEGKLATRQAGLASDTATFFPNAAQVRNPRLCRSLRAALIARDVAIFERCRVRGIRRIGGRFAGFETESGLIEAHNGVVACGAWSGELIRPFCGFTVFPVKGQMILLKGHPGLLRSILLHRGRYVIPRRDGRILVGSTIERDGFDVNTDATTARALLRSAADMMPALGTLPIERHWAGLRPATADECPLIGAISRLPGLYVNTGHYRNGVLCAPASAEVLLDRMRTSTPADKAFDPPRMDGR